MSLEIFLQFVTACIFGGAIALFALNAFDHIMDGVEEADDEYL